MVGNEVIYWKEVALISSAYLVKMLYKGIPHHPSGCLWTLDCFNCTCMVMGIQYKCWRSF